MLGGRVLDLLLAVHRDGHDEQHGHDDGDQEEGHEDLDRTDVEHGSPAVRRGRLLAGRGLRVGLLREALLRDFP